MPDMLTQRRVILRPRNAGGGGEPSEPAFVSTWDTTNTSTGSSDSDQITLPLTSAGTYDFTVDWGDGNQDEITAFDQAEVTHTYAMAGEYEITITGTITGWQFNSGGDRLKLLDVSQWGPFNPGGASAFHGAFNLGVTATDAPDLSGVTNLDNTFRMDGDSLGPESVDMREWDTSEVQRMALMFYNSAISEVLGLGDCDITSVAEFLTSMFNHCTLTTSNYDSILIGWEAQSVQDSVSFHGGNSTYTSGGAAEAARTALVSDHGWTITDGGAA